MANVNLKFDPTRGAYRLFEINCRYSTWTELPTRCGCNFPLVAYAAITGQEPPSLHQREGTEWLDFERDWDAMATYRREREWSWTSYFGSRSEEHTSELQSLAYLVCRLLLEKKKKNKKTE